MTDISVWKSVIAVIGAGVMGRDIAELLIARQFPVVLVDLSDEHLRTAKAAIRSGLRVKALTGHIAPNMISQSMDRLNCTTAYDALGDIDFVIENVSENIEAKRSVYAELDKYCHPDAVIAANTSTHPITVLGGLMRYPDRVVGIHFMNPATAKPVVEVIAGAQSSSAAMERAFAFLSAIGKEGVLVKDAPGFVSNRVLMLTINEAIQLVEAGTSSAADVDRIFVECFGHQMGPLATADLIGLDTIQFSLESLREYMGEAKFEPASLLKDMTRAGKLGRKTGQGFFRYEFTGQV